MAVLRKICLWKITMKTLEIRIPFREIDFSSSEITKICKNKWIFTEFRSNNIKWYTNHGQLARNTKTKIHSWETYMNSQRRKNWSEIGGQLTNCNTARKLIEGEIQIRQWSVFPSLLGSGMKETNYVCGKCAWVISSLESIFQY